MSKISLKQAAAWCGGTVEEKYADIEFLGANNDTRTLQPGQLFLALQGARDGHDFIPDAMEKGAAAVLCTHSVGDYPAIIVKDVRLALGDIARGERERIGMKVVGVTGSVGKSTTKEMIAAVLEKTYRTAKTPVNHNNDIGMPMAILGMPADTEVAVLEMGMNHFREMAYLSSIGKPDIAVIVNIGTAHIEYLGSQTGIRQAKMEIVEGMPENGTLLLNGDDRMLRDLDQIPGQRIVYFGADEGCAVRCREIVNAVDGLRFRVTHGDESFSVIMNLEGRHFVSDAMAAVAVGLEMGVPEERIRQGLRSFRNLAGRQETLRAYGYTLIKDCYNAGPESMEAALKVLGEKQGRKIAVLGDMLELGDRAAAEHYRIGRIAATKADVLYTYGVNTERMVSGAITGGMKQKLIEHFDTHEDLAHMLKMRARPGDVILFKGSRGMRLEKALALFFKEEEE